jgi:hypothetical protein
LLVRETAQRTPYSRRSPSPPPPYGAQAFCAPALEPQIEADEAYQASLGRHARTQERERARHRARFEEEVDADRMVGAWATRARVQALNRGRENEHEEEDEEELREVTQVVEEVGEPAQTFVFGVRRRLFRFMGLW